MPKFLVSLLAKPQKLFSATHQSPRYFFKNDKIKQVSKDKVELTFVASEELENKIKFLKGLLAHKHPNLSNGELFEMLFDLAIQEWNPSKTKSEIKVQKKIELNTGNESEPTGETKVEMPTKSRCAAPHMKLSYAKSRRQIYQRAKNRCENCPSKHALQIDHIIPLAKGGPDEPGNMRLLCRRCNQRAAIKHFGREKMEAYLT